MNASEKLAERKELFENAFDFKPNKRVPTLSETWGWEAFDAGYDLNVLYDYEKMEKAQDHLTEKYQFDAYTMRFTRNMLRVTRVLGRNGQGMHRVSDDGTQLFALDDHDVMTQADYPQFIEDFDMLIWTSIMKNYCDEGVTFGTFREGVKEYLDFVNFGIRMMKYAQTDGALDYFNAAYFLQAPIETLFSQLRGIKGLSMDMRRLDKGLLKEALDSYFNKVVLPGMKSAFEAPGDRGACVADASNLHLAHTILSEKQFAEFYWPYCKQIFDMAAANGKRVSVLAEGSILRFKEFLQEIPKGVAMYALEQDDPFEFRRELPNLAICAGMDSTLLGRGTPQECIDYARKYVDELGEGIVLAPNKMMAFKGDAKSENLLAVLEWARTYQP